MPIPQTPPKQVDDPRKHLQAPPQDEEMPYQRAGSEEAMLSSSWSDVKLLLYMTTHLPKQHVAFLPCWKDAMGRLELFQYRTDVLLYTSFQPTPEQLTFSPLNVTVHVYNNTGYHSGATWMAIRHRGLMSTIG